THTPSSVVLQKPNQQFNKTLTPPLLQQPNKPPLTIQQNLPTINNIKNPLYSPHKPLPNINHFPNKILYFNNHQPH
ncbi:hypothetical protein, partial [Staphylococcus aureus]|uniref:hypothetical protein n=1 Tax=Staphylococcus aureus TaxID=1280 RepID=UPI0021B3CB69